jgi:hypothetical protein
MHKAEKKYPQKKADTKYHFKIIKEKVLPEQTQ